MPPCRRTSHRGHHPEAPPAPNLRPIFLKTENTSSNLFLELDSVPAPLQEDLTEGITGAIHETGHALYEQGRNLVYDGLPVNSVGLLREGLLHPSYLNSVIEYHRVFVPYACVCNSVGGRAGGIEGQLNLHVLESFTVRGIGGSTHRQLGGRAGGWAGQGGGGGRGYHLGGREGRGCGTLAAEGGGGQGRRDVPQRMGRDVGAAWRANIYKFCGRAAGGFWLPGTCRLAKWAGQRDAIYHGRGK